MPNNPIADTNAERDEELLYNQIENWCMDQINMGSDFMYDPRLFESMMKSKSSELHFSHESLRSFFRSYHTKFIKSRACTVKSNRMECVEEYAFNRKSIKHIAKTERYSPALMARLILEEIMDPTMMQTKKINRLLKDPIKELHSIDFIKQEYRSSEYHQQQLQQLWVNDAHNTTKRLGYEVKEAVESDPLCGPIFDREKHFIGIEYELILERGLKKLGIPFESEAQLREKGSSKTPDVVLLSPVAFQVGTEWMIVNWIDSKAMYGDIDTHQNYVIPQAKSYIHRFGPGMICYWFGHAPRSKLDTANGELGIVQILPGKIMWPDVTIH